MSLLGLKRAHNVVPNAINVFCAPKASPYHHRRTTTDVSKIMCACAKNPVTIMIVNLSTEKRVMISSHDNESSGGVQSDITDSNISEETFDNFRDSNSNRSF